jgi:O-antigen/teichoic acid export membrane protein
VSHNATPDGTSLPESMSGDDPPLDAESSPKGPVGRIRTALASASVRGAAKLVGGSGLAQLITLAAAPILTRLFTPSDFGALAIYTSVSAILIAIAGGRYEMAIMLPKDDEEAASVTGIALLLVTTTAFVTLIGSGVAFFLLPGVSESSLGAWVFILPATVLMGGWSATFAAYAIRNGEFGTVASTGVVRQGVGAATAIGLGLLKFGAGGLILGGFFSVAAANLRLGRPVFRDLESRRPTRGQLRASARRYSKFPRHTLPANLLATTAISGLPVLIGSLYGAATLGVWSLTDRILAMPSVLVGYAASETYYRRAVQLRDSPKQALRLFDKTVISLATISIVPFVVIGVLGEWLFGFIFGPEWSEAGVYARIMLPWLWVRFISSPVLRTTNVYERNSVGLMMQAILMLILVTTGAAAVIWSLQFTHFLAILSGASALAYTGFIALSRHLVRQGWTSPT